MSPSKLNLRPGLTLGRNYYIVEFLGAGWEGEVYKVEERRTGIVRAAKIFYEGHIPSEAKLRRYTQRMARLRNCPIITQYHHRDIARVGRSQVEILVSDFAQGEMLSGYLERQPRKRMTTFAALHLLHALAAGVEQIHFLGDYHGDIHSDNIMVRRFGLGFELRLVDFFDLGAPTRTKIQNDVIDMVNLLHELIGGDKGYRSTGPEIRQFVLGRKHSLIRKSFRDAGQLRLALDNLTWD